MNMLARHSRLYAAAAVTAKRIGDSEILRSQNLSATTENGVAADLIESARKKFSVTQRQLTAEAGIGIATYQRILAAPDRAKDLTLGRLADALRRISRKQKLDDVRATALMEAVYGGFLLAVAPFYRVTAAQVRATDPQAGHTGNDTWRRCAHARQAAIYLTNTSLNIGQRAIARTVGLTEAAVCLAVRAVEARRDDPAFDRMLDAAAQDVTGRLLP